MKKLAKRVFLTLLGAFLAIQLIPSGRTNPPIDPQKKLSPPPEVELILRASCYDCHSDETRWPWYAYVAPVSWWTVGHVNDGKRSLNLSQWADIAQASGQKVLSVDGQPATTAQIQCKVLGDMESEMVTGEMPPANYLSMHPDARISPEQFRTVTDWFHAMIQKLSAPVGSAKQRVR